MNRVYRSRYSHSAQVWYVSTPPERANQNEKVNHYFNSFFFWQVNLTYRNWIFKMMALRNTLASDSKIWSTSSVWFTLSSGVFCFRVWPSSQIQSLHKFSPTDCWWNQEFHRLLSYVFPFGYGRPGERPYARSHLFPPFRFHAWKKTTTTVNERWYPGY